MALCLVEPTVTVDSGTLVAGGVAMASALLAIDPCRMDLDLQLTTSGDWQMPRRGYCQERQEPIQPAWDTSSKILRKGCAPPTRLSASPVRESGRAVLDQLSPGQLAQADIEHRRQE